MKRAPRRGGTSPPANGVFALVESGVSSWFEPGVEKRCLVGEIVAEPRARANLVPNGAGQRKSAKKRSLGGLAAEPKTAILTDSHSVAAIG